MENIIEGLQRELERNRELLGLYLEIGPAGAFGASSIRADITMAERAIADQDTVAMLRAYKALEGNR